MSDKEQNTNEQNTAGQAAAPTVDLDLRPKTGTLLYELLRLGLVYDHDDGTTQSWYAYDDGLRADFKGEDASEVTFTDTTTHVSRVVETAKLKDTASVITWKTGGLS